MNSDECYARLKRGPDDPLSICDVDIMARTGQKFSICVCLIVLCVCVCVCVCVCTCVCMCVCVCVCVCV